MRKIIGIAAVLLLTGCADYAANQQENIAMLSAVTDLQGKINDIESRVATLEVDQRVREMNEHALLTPGNDGYQIIETDFGMVVIVLDDIKQYADGTKVKLRFVSAASVTLTDVSAFFEWGRTNQNRIPSDIASSKKVKFNSSLLPARWIVEEFTLEKLPATEFGYLRIKTFDTGGIQASLSR